MYFSVASSNRKCCLIKIHTVNANDHPQLKKGMFENHINMNQLQKILPRRKYVALTDSAHSGDVDVNLSVGHLFCV